jgi:hypothetical protein
MSLDFTAIDFETANSYRGSPCSVGPVKVRDGQIVDQSCTLIHPPARFNYFDGFNIWLHGINAQMVADAPRWRQVAWDDVAKAGGIPELSVTQRTNILIIGDINPAVLAPGMATTGKAAKAFALQDKGQDIEVMTEDDFLRSL